MTHQSGITGLGTTDHVFLELDLHEGCDPHGVLARLAAACNLPTTAGSNVVLGVRPSLWATVAPAEDIPADVHDFDTDLQGAGDYSLPATQHDAWLWVNASTRSQAFEVASHILRELGDDAHVVQETIGWIYESNRDLTGFEDGTENPTALEAPGVVAIPAGQPGAGASVLLWQLWEHQAPQWNALEQHRQEQIIGRTKPDSVEFTGAEQPADSHVSRTSFKVDGISQEIYRRNVPYGTVAQHGTAFVGFAHRQYPLEEMLRRMAGVGEDGGPRDALTYFTTAVAGGWYVCPSVEALLTLSAAAERG